jgi:hypothetical protein
LLTTLFTLSYLLAQDDQGAEFTSKSIPLPTGLSWLQKFNAPIGSADKDVQAKLFKHMQLSHQAGVGKVI